MKTQLKMCLVIGVSMFAMVGQCGAAAVTWALADGVGGNWETAANWAGLPMGQTEPGAADDVVIGGNKGTITITNDAAVKKVKSFQILTSGIGAPTKLVGGIAPTGRALNVEIESVGDIKIGTKNEILVPPCVAGPLGDAKPGGRVLLKTTAGDIEIQSHTCVVNAGQGFKDRGGDIEIDATGKFINNGKVEAGKAADGAKKRGGHLTVKATVSILNSYTAGPPVQPALGAYLRGGQGSKYIPVGTPGATPPGDGGNVTLESKDIENKGLVYGGNSGADDAPSGSGGNVLITATNNLTLAETSSLSGGWAIGAVNLKITGSVSATFGVMIKGVKGNKIEGRRVHGTKVVEPPGVAGAPTVTAVIDFSDADPGTIVASEGVCLDAGPDGIINFTKAAADAVVVPCGLEDAGSIHLYAGEILGDYLSATEPDALQAPCTACLGECSGDLNSDCQVNAMDLALLLSAWSGRCGPADLNGDNLVNGFDLGLLLGQWGPCTLPLNR